jgi:hypothetical protein
VLVFWPFFFEPIRKAILEWVRANGAAVREWLLEFIGMEAAMYLVTAKPESASAWVLLIGALLSFGHFAIEKARRA